MIRITSVTQTAPEIEVTSLGFEPDPDWRFEDSDGTVHRWHRSKDGRGWELPTLVEKRGPIEPAYCRECGHLLPEDEWEPGEYWWEAPTGERVEPGRRAPHGGRHFMPGRLQEMRFGFKCDRLNEVIHPKTQEPKRVALADCETADESVKLHGFVYATNWKGPKDGPIAGEFVSSGKVTVEPV